MLRQAIQYSSNGSCSLSIAKLSNRMAKGDFDKVSGRAFSMMRSVALWKDKEKTSVRPIGIGDALKRIIVRAHCDHVRVLIEELVWKHEFGLMKGGYEAAIHTMRALAEQCKEDLDVIVVLDFANAFNSCNRNLLIKLAVTAIPEIAPLAYWLYAEETELFLSNGSTLISSEGVHQGCGLANLLFALIMRFIMRHLPSEGVSAKGSYWDDGFTKSTPAAALEVFKAILKLKPVTNLEASLWKCHLYAPNDEVAKECEHLFKDFPDVHIHSKMNVKFLNTPVGSDDFVTAELNTKLETLKSKVESISKMPFKMEAFNLLKTCLSRCRVTHLMRVLPPLQITKFLGEWDSVLRNAFEVIINSKLDDKWWAVVRLNSKYGGMGLKSGIHTAGAQHLTSLVNSADGIKKFIPSWNLHESAREATEGWLCQQLGRTVNINLLVDSVSEGQGFGENSSLSLAQWCESEEESRVIESINNEERFHVA